MSHVFALDEIVAATKNNNVVVKKLDLSLMASVREFSEDVRRTEQRLDVLIHNAGVANTFSKRVTPEGLEITMATNQFGPYLLTHLLMGNVNYIVSFSLFIYL